MKSSGGSHEEVRGKREELGSLAQYLSGLRHTDDSTQYSMYVSSSHTYSKSMDQPGKVANPMLVVSRTGKMIISRSSFVPENLVSRDGSAVRPTPIQF